VNVQEALRLAHRRLLPVTETPSLDAQVLLAHVLGQFRAWVLAHPDAVVPPDKAVRLEHLLARLEAGEPLPYLLGHWEFYGLDFEISPAVLIPRPETELLVDAALDWLKQRPGRRCFADVGTGSGCIAASLAVHLDAVTGLAIDQSFAALQVAQRNFRKHGVAERVLPIQADLLAPAHGPLDLVCANLPYIPTETLRKLSVARFEPVTSLDGGPDGLVLIRRLIADLPGKLSPGGRLLLEIETSLGEETAQLAGEVFPQGQIEVRKDLAGHDRLVVVDLPAG